MPLFNPLNLKGLFGKKEKLPEELNAKIKDLDYDAINGAFSNLMDAGKKHHDEEMERLNDPDKYKRVDGLTVGENSDVTAWIDKGALDEIKRKIEAEKKQRGK